MKSIARWRLGAPLPHKGGVTALAGKRRGNEGNLALGLIATASLVLAACGGQSGAAAPHPTATATIPAKWRGIAQTPLPEATPPYSFPASWQNPQDTLSNVSGFAFAPSAAPVGYACTAQGQVETGAAAGVDACYGTTDGGQTWSPLASIPIQHGLYLSLTVDESDPRDVFLAGYVPWATNPEQITYALWRSRDAGANWARLGQPGIGYPLALQGVAVVGARIVVSVNVAREGSLPSNLFASNDGGATWCPLGINLGGQGLNAVGMVAFGTTLLVGAAPPAGGSTPLAFHVPLGPQRLDAPASACGPSEPAGTPSPASWHPGIACGDTSNPTPVPTAYWRTTYGGHTWAQVHIPGDMPTFTREATAGSCFGVSHATVDGNSVAYWTRDAGATWTALPTLLGVDGGYTDPASVGSDGELAVGPDGTVFVGTWHHPQEPYAGAGGPAGVFTIRPTDPAPQWQPLASDIPTPPQGWQATPGPHSARLWAIADTLMYVDVP